MAINPTPPGIEPTAPGSVPPRQNPDDPMRGDHMNPYGKTRGAGRMYWVVGAIVVAILVIGFIFMRQPPATVPPASQTTGETAPAEPVPVTPTPPEPATPTPTVPVTPTQPEPTAPTQP